MGCGVLPGDEEEEEGEGVAVAGGVGADFLRPIARNTLAVFSCATFIQAFPSGFGAAFAASLSALRFASALFQLFSSSPTKSSHLRLSSELITSGTDLEGFKFRDVAVDFTAEPM